MVSLWGSNKDGNGDDNGAADAHRAGEASHEPLPRHSVEVNEHTRLLPPPASREGFLSPDDPAVSPLNLWSVRFIRYFTILFLAITFLWWVLLLVSIFVSPPGMHARGSGFFDFSYTTLTLGNLLIALLFFSAPSKAAQVTCLVISVLLLADMILIVSVPQLRREEGWVGIASVVWALIVSIWAVIADRVVASGKREEEERLTGRSEDRRTLSEWISVLVSTVILIILAAVVVLLSATLILRSRDSSLAAPGHKYLVDGEKYELHLYCSSDKAGKGVTTVLFEAGERPFEHSFQQVAESALKNGTIDRYCFADRPGFGWSENAPSPFSAGMGADVLSEALAQAGETGPWILASAGVGSIYSRIFSARHGRDVKGLLLVDPLHEDLLHRLSSPRNGFLYWAWGVISPLGLDRIAGALFRGRTREDRVYGRASYQNGKYIKAKLQEALVADSLTRNEVSIARTVQGQKTPLVVVSSGIEVRRDNTWGNKQRDLTHLTDKLVDWDVVNKAPHEVWQTYEGREAIEKGLKALA